jgi:hypothetical protein
MLQMNEKFRIGKLKERVCANKEATDPRVSLCSVEVSLRKINGRHHDLFYRYGIYVSQRTTDMFHLRQTLPS